MFICHYPIPSEPTIRHSITQYTAKRKKHQSPLAIPYRHSQKLLERAVASCLLRGCGVLTRAARKVRNDSGGIRAKKRLSGALLSSENWLMQGEMADLQSGLGGRSTPRNGPEGSVPCCVLKRRAGAPLWKSAISPCVRRRDGGFAEATAPVNLCPAGR